MKPTKKFPFIEGMRYHHDCERCGAGTYEERSLFDDWDGRLTCEVCGHRPPAYYSNDKKQSYIPPDEEEQKIWRYYAKTVKRSKNDENHQ